MASAETDRLRDLRNWLITFTSWQEWVDSDDEAELSSRITWPVNSTLTEWPQMVLELGGHRYQNITGAAAGSNFQPRGEIRLLIWDLDEAPNNPDTSYENFADHFFGLMEEMANKAHQSALMFEALETEPFPIVHTSGNERYEEELQMWHGVIRIRWGVAG